MTDHEAPVPTALERLPCSSAWGWLTHRPPCRAVRTPGPSVETPTWLPPYGTQEGTAPPRLRPQLLQGLLCSGLDGFLRQHADLLVDVFNASGSVDHLFPWRYWGGKRVINASHRPWCTWRPRRDRALERHRAGPSRSFAAHLSDPQPRLGRKGVACVLGTKLPCMPAVAQVQEQHPLQLRPPPRAPRSCSVPP